MASHRSVAASIALCGALGLTLSACGGSDPVENETAACDAYAEFGQSLKDAAGSLSASSTIDEINEARDSVRTSYQNLSEALGDVNEDRKQALTDAWDSFDQAVKDVDKDQTVPEAISSLTADIVQVEAAQQALGADLQCE